MLWVNLYMGSRNLLLNCGENVDCFYVRHCLVDFKRQSKPKDCTVT